MVKIRGIPLISTVHFSLQHKPKASPSTLFRDPLSDSDNAFDRFASIKLLVQPNENEPEQSSRAETYEDHYAVDAHSNDWLALVSTLFRGCGIRTVARSG